MVYSDYTMSEIAFEFGVSKARIEQVMYKLKNLYGVDLSLRKDRDYWTIRDICSVFGFVSEITAREIIARANLVEPEDVTYRGKKTMITYSGVKKIEQSLYRECAVCGKRYSSTRKNSAVCSQECSDRRCTADARERQYKYCPTYGISAIIANEIRALPESDEPWHKVRYAVSHTALSRMQVEWLIARKVIPVKPHPHEMWGNQPVKTVRISHLLIAEKHYRLAGKLHTERLP